MNHICSSGLGHTVVSIAMGRRCGCWGCFQIRLHTAKPRRRLIDWVYLTVRCISFAQKDIAHLFDTDFSGGRAPPVCDEVTSNTMQPKAATVESSKREVQDLAVSGQLVSDQRVGSDRALDRQAASLWPESREKKVAERTLHVCIASPSFVHREETSSPLAWCRLRRTRRPAASPWPMGRAS